ncbi:NAD-dependent epimerase/dehydratase family protein [Evansella clarkii]|uniref:NAD-dependent epimerase/dehydratase family protein n=1 Tax=Evansella clarkii TaxID=79879 RepID=UPI000B4364CC|nr:NAD-dependent epimerase/dehydratase family protein [Evansella clarkii]
MIQILIIGSSSYVGNNIKKWLAKEPKNYCVDAISIRDNSWKKKNFSNYKVVIYVAGIAHKKETKENAKEYYEVNRDLTYAVAVKAKADKVQQFIFLSSMSVYGLDTGIIEENTPLKPKSNYGISKLQAEELLKTLDDQEFHVAILRPPMIYGKGCKGNYKRLSKLARITPFFPMIENKRSMVYIDNLSEFIKQLVDKEKSGIFFPQNEEYVCTSDLVVAINKIHGNRVILVKFLNFFIKLMKSKTMLKVFGNLVYEKRMSKDENIEKYCLIDFKESIRLTEE